MRFRWRKGRVVLGLLVYWLTSTVGAGLLVRAGQAEIERGWVIFVVLVFVSVCMATERGQWNDRRRVGFVALAWIIHSAVLAPVAFAIIFFAKIPIPPDLVDRTIFFSAGIPVVIWAMQRSRLFVTSVHPEQQIPDRNQREAHKVSTPDDMI